MLQQLFVSVPAEGLQGLWDSLLRGWVGPVFVAAIAIFGLTFLKDRSWTKIISFVGIAAIVGVLLFAGGDLFGSKDKGITGAAKQQAEKVGNDIVLVLDK